MATADISTDASKTNNIMAKKIRVRKESFFSFIGLNNALNIAIIEPKALNYFAILKLVDALR